MGSHPLIRRHLALIFVFLLWLTAPVAAEEATILLLHSYHKGFSWTETIDARLRTHLAGEGRVLYSEFLDSKRHPHAAWTARFAAYLKAKYGALPPDLIVASDNNALVFLQRHRAELFSGTPIVFCGVNDFQAAMIAGLEERVTGVVERTDPQATLRLIRRLQPEVRRLILISGATQTAARVKAAAAKALSAADEIELLWWDALSTSELQRRLATLAPPRDAVLLILFNRDGEGRFYSYQQAARMVSRNTRAPVYGLWDFYLGHGVVGGMMASSRDQGDLAAGLAARFLASGNLPPMIDQSPNRPIFDYEVMARHGLARNRLPTDSRLINRPPTRHWPYVVIAGLGAFLTALTLLSLKQTLRPSRAASAVSLGTVITRHGRSATLLLALTLMTVFSAQYWFKLDRETALIRERILENKKVLVKTVVQAAVDRIRSQQREMAARGASPAEIRRRVRELFAAVEFAHGDGYFFIYHVDGTKILNPSRGGAGQSDHSGVRDPEGIPVIPALIQAAQRPGGGYVGYQWTRPGSAVAVDKLSYVCALPDLPWVVGTGIYLDDIEAEVAEARKRLMVSFGVDIAATLFAGSIVLVTMMLLSRRFTRHIGAELAHLIAGFRDRRAGHRGPHRPAYRIFEFEAIADSARKAVADLATARHNQRILLNNIQTQVWYLTDAGTYGAVNQAHAAFFGKTTAQLAFRSLTAALPAEAAHALVGANRQVFAGGRALRSEEWVTDSAGERRLISILRSPQLDEQGRVETVVCSAEDITEVRQMETELRQAQKMEAIGTLAGGIAHDFNNILASILGFTELAHERAPEGSSQRGYLQEVLNASQRAKHLVRQILAFARQGDEEMRPLQLRPLVKEVLKFLRASIPTTIAIRSDVESRSMVKGNATQIHQVLMNLCTNAAHAMESGGGELFVGLKEVAAESGSAQGDAAPTHVRLTVTDTGSGIRPEVLKSIFNPYFTTKPQGKGSGMGLAVVHGIVEGCGGTIAVDSRLGAGTTFTVDLPIVRKRAPAVPSASDAVPLGTERLLLVDDEAAIVRMGAQMLERLGYRVTTCTGSIEALSLFRERPDDFDGVITDMTMPDMTGAQLSAELVKIRPELPIIICTGFSEHMDAGQAEAMGIRGFLTKPVVRSQMAQTIRRVLDRREACVAAALSASG